MNWQMFWQQLDLAGRIYYGWFGLVLFGIIGYVFILFVVPAIKYRWPSVPDKNHPKKVQVSFADEYVTLERRWSFSKCRWEYVLIGELPYQATPPDEEWEKTKHLLNNRRVPKSS